MTHLDTLRRLIAATADHDAIRDLSEESSSRSNYARLLRAAQDLDAAATPATGYTPEPWHVSSSGLVILADGGKLGDMAGLNTSLDEDAANAARAVQCVNACAGMNDPAAVLAEVRKALRHIIGTAPDNAVHVAERALARLNGKE